MASAVGAAKVAEAPLLARHRRERQPAAAELGRHRQPQVARRAQLLEVVREEHVVAIVLRRPPGEAREHLVGQGCLGFF